MSFLVRRFLTCYHHHLGIFPRSLPLTSPLPRSFLDICTRAGLLQYLPLSSVRGGVDVDGVPLRTGEGEEVEGVGGRWMLAGGGGDMGVGVGDRVGEGTSADAGTGRPVVSLVGARVS